MSKQSKAKPVINGSTEHKMDIDSNEEHKNASFLDMENIEYALKDFKIKSIGRNDIEKYIELLNKNSDNDDRVKIKSSKLINCMTRYYKAFRISIYIKNIFVMDINFVKEKKNIELKIDNINILEWNEYKIKREIIDKSQNIVQLSKHCLFQKLTSHSRIFHKQIERKILKKHRKQMNDIDDNINPKIEILHGIVIWLNQYSDLYDKECSGCNQLLSYDCDQYGLLLPTIRINDNNIINAYHISCVPIKS